MTHDYVATERTFWIAHGYDLSYGELQPGECVSSGQPFFETFERRLPWIERIQALGGDYFKDQ